MQISFTYHFFSGIGLGTVFTLHGTSALPDKFRPRIAPTRFNGSTTNKQIQATMSYKTVTVMYMYLHYPKRLLYHCTKRYGTRGVVVNSDKIDDDDSGGYKQWE